MSHICYGHPVNVDDILFLPILPMMSVLTLKEQQQSRMSKRPLLLLTLTMYKAITLHFLQGMSDGQIIHVLGYYWCYQKPRFGCSSVYGSPQQTRMALNSLFCGDIIFSVTKLLNFMKLNLIKIFYAWSVQQELE